MAEPIDDGPHAMTYVRVNDRRPGRYIDAEDPVWELLNEMYDKGEFQQFRKWARAGQGLESLGKLGAMIGRFLTWVAALAVAYATFSGMFTDWFRGGK